MFDELQGDICSKRYPGCGGPRKCLVMRDSGKLLDTLRSTSDSCLCLFRIGFKVLLKLNFVT